MTITIPGWVLWLLAIPIGAAALVLMACGIMLIVAFWDWKPYRCT